MPINGGVIILNNRRPDVVRRFLTQVYKVYNELYAEQGKWFGDQLALHNYLQLSIEDMKNCPIVEVNGARILFLPCETYNFSPENEIASVQTGLHDKFLLHFKGPRKRLMKLFWDAHLLPKTRHFPFGYYPVLDGALEVGARWQGNRNQLTAQSLWCSSAAPFTGAPWTCCRGYQPHDGAPDIGRPARGENPRPTRKQEEALQAALLAGAERQDCNWRGSARAVATERGRQLRRRKG